jgi:hypothetical protein
MIVCLHFMLQILHFFLQLLDVLFQRSNPLIVIRMMMLICAHGRLLVNSAPY